MTFDRTKKEIVLASASPRRKEILSMLGADIEVVTADTDETCDISDPILLTEELARRKGRAVYDLLSEKGEADGRIIISADTVVACEGRILGKPRDRADAIEMIRLISGKEHLVVSGICVTVGGVSHVSHSATRVFIDEIPEEGIIAYVDSGDPYDKAGGYGIQGAFSKWVRGIEGCYFGVVGLPTGELNRLFFQATGRYI